MKKRWMLFTLIGVLAGMTGCTVLPDTSSSSSVPSSSLVEQQTFRHTDAFYSDLANSMDIAMLPLFENVTETTPQDQSQYFFYFVNHQQLYHGGDDWWKIEERVYRIPMEDISQVLSTYLEVEQFDAETAFGTQMQTPDYTEVPLGYDVEKEEYVIALLDGGRGGRSTKLLEKELLGKDRVMVTVGFYDLQENGDLYKKKILTLRETEDPDVYVLLSSIDLNLIDGKEVVVYGKKE